VRLPEALEYAYGVPDAQMIIPDEFVNRNRPDRPSFDVLVSAADHPREKLQAMIKQKLGLNIERQILDADVWLLQLKNPNAPGLDRTNDPTALALTNLIWGANKFLGKPVIDQTGLTGRYRYSVRWPPYQAQNPHYRQESIDAYQQAWLDQLGLAFVPTNQPVEMLVVTKAR
jgi:hypothetical protein